MKIVSQKVCSRAICMEKQIHCQLKGKKMIMKFLISLYPLPKRDRDPYRYCLLGNQVLLLYNRKNLSLLCQDVLYSKEKFLLMKAMSMVNHDTLHNNSETLKVNKLRDNLLVKHLVALVCLKQVRMSKFLYLALLLQNPIKTLMILIHK